MSQCRLVGWLVFQEVETLAAVKGKLLVARQEREPLGDGMGYDDVVAGVAVIIPSLSWSSAYVKAVSRRRGRNSMP